MKVIWRSVSPINRVLSGNILAVFFASQSLKESQCLPRAKPVILQIQPLTSVAGRGTAA